MAWTLAFYRTPRGERPAIAFVEQLPESARAEVVALLAALRERGNRLRPPHAAVNGSRDPLGVRTILSRLRGAPFLRTLHHIARQSHDG